MSTAVTKAAPAAAPAKAPIRAGGDVLAMVPQTIEEAFRLADGLARAGDMVPKHFQGQPAMIMAAILRGAEIGLAPMQAMASIAVINGRASLWGDALPALMLRAGHHVDVRIEGEGDSAVAIATLERGDTGRKFERRFSMADAARAGLKSKSGPWQQYPTRMLAMRARSWAIRDGAADALMGLTVSDEAMDMIGAGPDGARDVTPRAARARFADDDDAPARIEPRARVEPEIDPEHVERLPADDAFIDAEPEHDGDEPAPEAEAGDVMQRAVEARRRMDAEATNVAKLRAFWRALERDDPAVAALPYMIGAKDDLAAVLSGAEAGA